MGCERVRDGSTMGYGAVRASMERRWLVNAKTTIMRQRKWQEIQLQKELDEQRKKTEILERRKQERARLSAYIHSRAHPPVKCATNGKHHRNDNKRVKWKTCLLKDHEHILKLRENAKAIMLNRPSQQDCLNPDPVMHGHHSCRMAHCDSGPLTQELSLPSKSHAQNLCMNKNLDDLVKLLEARNTSTDVVTQNQLLENNDHSAYQILQPPRTRSTTCEIAVNTSATWARNTIPREANFANNHQSSHMFEINNGRSLTASNIFYKHDESQCDKGVLPNSQDTRAPTTTKVATYCVESVSNTHPEFALLEIASSEKGESPTSKSGPDLKEEILKSRLKNEAATTRLIAQVTAIESRLDDCNMKWKSICHQEDKVEDTEPMQILGSEVHRGNLNSVKKAGHQLTFNNKIDEESSRRVLGWGDKQDFPGSEGELCPHHVSKARLFMSSPGAEVSNHISLGCTISGSSLVPEQGGITQGLHGNFEIEHSQHFQQLYTNTSRSSSHQRPLSHDHVGTSSEALEGQQCAQHASTARMSLLSAGAGISFDGAISGSLVSNVQSEFTHGIHANSEREELQSFEQLYMNKPESMVYRESQSCDEGASSVENRVSNMRLVEQVMSHPGRSPICHESDGALEKSISSLLPVGKSKSDNSRDFFACHDDLKPTQESHNCPPKTGGDPCDSIATDTAGADSLKESHSAWKIDWNERTDIFPEKDWEGEQSAQAKYSSPLPNSARIRVGLQSLHRSPQQQNLMYEPRQHKLPPFLNCENSSQNNLHIHGAEDHPPWRVKGSTHSSHFPASETSNPVQDSSSFVEPGWHDQDQYTCHHANWAQNGGHTTPMLAGRKKNYKNVGPCVEYLGDKENQLESERQSLIEEEQKIFASLERLDWKLAAINLRSMNVGRESAASQGQYSTKSAPANLGLPPRTVVENFSMTAKKVIPYSALPPHPLTPQGAPMLRIQTAKQRRQVGITNKTGRMHNLNQKK